MNNSRFLSSDNFLSSAVISSSLRHKSSSSSAYFCVFSTASFLNSLTAKIIEYKSWKRELYEEKDSLHSRSCFLVLQLHSPWFDQFVSSFDPLPSPSCHFELSNVWIAQWHRKPMGTCISKLIKNSISLSLWTKNWQQKNAKSNTF